MKYDKTSLALALASCAIGCGARAPIVETAANVPEDVLVHVDSNRPHVVLARLADSAIATATGPGGTAIASAEGYEHVCGAPCDMKVRANLEYVFLGVSGGLEGKSNPFILPPGDRVTLRVDSGSPGMWFLGAMAAGAGGTATLTGGLLWLVSGESSTTGAIIALAGLPVLALGIWMVVRNETHVTTSNGGELTRRTPSRSPTSLHATATGVAWNF